MRYDDQLVNLYFTCFEHFGIGISDLFRISIFAIPRVSLAALQIGKTFCGPPLKVVA
jgi:hypothetical protein